MQTIKTFPLFLGCRGAVNAEHATNQISASPSPLSEIVSVCSPSYSSPGKRRYINFISPVKSPSLSPSESCKSELIG